MRDKKSKLETAAVIALVVLLSPIWLPIVLLLAIIALGVHVLRRSLVNFLIWTTWVPRGKDVLFVSSDSTIWKEYMEQEVLPIVGSRAERLNWSERKRWKKYSLGVQSFRSYSGDQGFNPMVIVFRPFRPAIQFRYFDAFRDFKHGRPEGVRSITSDLARLMS